MAFAKSSSNASVAPVAGPMRVLIVDDHELLRMGLAELLENQPNTQVCGQASGEQEALALARESGPNLAIIDISLAEGNGIELIKRVASLDPALRIVALSSYDDSLYAERALRAGAHGYINKQTPARQILTAIRHVWNGNYYLNEQMTNQLLGQVTGLPGSAVALVETLSDRELEVFTYIGRGQSSGQIAKELHLSPRTIATYRERLKVKLQLESGAELNRAAIQWVLNNS